MMRPAALRPGRPGVAVADPSHRPDFSVALGKRGSNNGKLVPRKGRDMAETYIVDVNLQRLREHRSLVERRQLSDHEVQVWLVNFGFYPRVDGLYVAEQAVLDRLEPADIIEARRVAAEMPA